MSGRTYGRSARGRRGRLHGVHGRGAVIPVGTGLRYLTRICLLLMAVTLGAGHVAAQVLTPRGIGLGDAGVASEEFWGGGANPAGRLPTGRRIGVQVYGTTPLDPAQLTRLGVDLGLRGERTGATVGLQHFAPPGLTTTALRLGVARQLSPALEVGLRVGAAFGNYAEYGEELVALAEGGIRYRVTGSLQAGADYYYAQRELYPLTQRRLRIGVDYASSERLHIALAVSQSPTLPLSVHVGLDYRPAERLALALGYVSLGQSIHLAARVRLAGGLVLATGVGVYSQLPVHAHYGVAWGR